MEAQQVDWKARRAARLAAAAAKDARDATVHSVLWVSQGRRFHCAGSFTGDTLEEARVAAEGALAEFRARHPRTKAWIVRGTGC
jgi:hypothetical protein